MTSARNAVTRRQFIEALGAIGGAGAVYHGLTTLGLIPIPSAQAAERIPEIGIDVGKGKSVVVLGAGLAGLCAAYVFANNGFRVQVIEANDRYGGRSLTLHPGDSFHEVGGPEQVCRFTEPGLYFNAGPGRIPQHHAVVLDYCRRFKLPVQPYVFLSEANLLQHDKAFGGKPIPFRRIRHNLRGHIAELLAKVTQQGELDKVLTPADRERFLTVLRMFGDLRRRPDGAFAYRIPTDPSQGYARSGYSVEPGAGLHDGDPYPMIDLQKILAFDLSDVEAFGHLLYMWQTSLLEPVGGMDEIWRGFLRQPVPQTASLDASTSGAAKTLKDLVTLGSPVKSVRNTADGVEVQHGNDLLTTADFCVSTMAPIQLVQVGRGFSTGFVSALAGIEFTPACKVGWQTKSRFWEVENQIYGGISWTDHITSQIWYPSDGYLTDTGVLTAAYIFSDRALEFGSYPIEKRIELALEGGEKLHPGSHRQNVKIETALAIAWQNMPYFIGGWANEPLEQRPLAYKRLNEVIPEGQIYLAGDYLSYWPGWQEGALAAAHLAYEQIRDRVTN